MGRPWGPPVILLGDFWAPRDAVGESLGLTFGKPLKTQRFLMVFKDFSIFKGSKCPTVVKSNGARALRNPIFPIFCVPSDKRSSKSRGSLGVSRWIFEHPYSVFLTNLHGAYTRDHFFQEGAQKVTCVRTGCAHGAECAEPIPASKLAAFSLISKLAAFLAQA